MPAGALALGMQDMLLTPTIELDPASNADHPVALKTRNLSRAFAGKVLVDGITVQLRQGEVVAVVGPSGAGKSSFLRLLNRLDEPTAGTVLVKGRDYRQMRPQDLRRRVGMVMQTAYLFPGTVAANLTFGPRQRDQVMTPSQIAALLDRVGLPGFQERDVSRLSGGEAQRVCLARALANSPETLLLDEPTSALDDTSEQSIEELVLGVIRERRTTAVIVTHDIAQACRIADRTMILEGGRLVRRRVRAMLDRVAQSLEPIVVATFTAVFPNVKCLTTDVVSSAQIRHRKYARIVISKQSNSLFHRTGLLERHRSTSAVKTITLTCQASTRSKLSGISPDCTAAAPHPNPCGAFVVKYKVATCSSFFPRLLRWRRKRYTGRAGEAEAGSAEEQPAEE